MKTGLKISGFLCLGIIVSLALLFLWAKRGIPLDRLELYRAQSATGRSVGERPSNLEAGSMTDRSLLKVYHLFSEDMRETQRYLNDLVESGGLASMANNRLFIETDIELEPLKSNDCRQIYCYQRRMSFEQIPSILWNGLIGIEDNRFLDHHGVDPRSIARAILADIRERRFAQGGSTITQQLVKNLFLTNEKTISRKVREMILAIMIEGIYPKENIIEAYFNEVFWGSLDGIRIKGVYAASLIYFGVKPQYLNEYQATILIALLKGPYFYHPLRHIERLRGRVDVVFRNLQELGHYSVFGAEPWDEEQWLSWQKELRERVSSRLIRSVWKVLERKEQTGTLLSEYEHLSYVWSSELLLTDLHSQAEGLDWGVKIYIKSLESGKSFAHYSKHERSLEAAIKRERHQTGSLLKPIVYHEAAQLGLDLETKFETKEFTLDLLSGPWSPREVSRNLPAEVSLEESLQRSLNRPTIRIAQEVGFGPLEEKLKERFPGLLTPLAEYPAQLLGALELSIEELSQSFGGLIQEACELHELTEPPLVWLTDPRRTTLRGVIDPNLEGVRYFGKTGTSNEGWDTVFIAFDGERISTIWVGQEGRRDGENLIRLFGSTTAYRVYQNGILWRGRRFAEFGCPRS